MVPVALAVWTLHANELGMERHLGGAVVKASVQLTLVGYVLKSVFEMQGLTSCLGYILVMALVAGRVAGQRAPRVPGGQLVATGSITLVLFGTLAMMRALHIFPWQPRYVVTTAGMIMGTTLTLTGQTLQLLHANISSRRGQIEAALALGAPPGRAVASEVRRSVTVALGPTCDYCSAMGLVTLPGAMTGAIMGGASPIQAVQLQMEVLYMLVGAAALTCQLAAALGWRGFFTPTHQLNLESLLP